MERTKGRGSGETEGDGEIFRTPRMRRKKDLMGSLGQRVVLAAT